MRGSGDPLAECGQPPHAPFTSYLLRFHPNLHDLLIGLNHANKQNESSF